MVEVLLHDIDMSKELTHKKIRSVGYSLTPLFYEELPISVDIVNGSPRDLLMSTLSDHPPNATGSIMYYECKRMDGKLKELMPLIPDNTLIG